MILESIEGLLCDPLNVVNFNYHAPDYLSRIIIFILVLIDHCFLKFKTGKRNALLTTEKKYMNHTSIYVSKEKVFINCKITIHWKAPILSIHQSHVFTTSIYYGLNVENSPNLSE